MQKRKKEPYRAEENNAADEGYSSYEEQEEYGQPEYASEGYQEAAYEIPDMSRMMPDMSRNMNRAMPNISRERLSSSR